VPNAPDPNDKTKAQTSNKTTPPSIGIDVDYYQAIIDDPEVSEDRKREFIAMIGSIVMDFIDIGFGVHPVQQATGDRQEPNPKPTKKETLPERSDA